MSLDPLFHCAILELLQRWVWFPGRWITENWTHSERISCHHDFTTIPPDSGVLTCTYYFHFLFDFVHCGIFPSYFLLYCSRACTYALSITQEVSHINTRSDNSPKLDLILASWIVGMISTPMDSGMNFFSQQLLKYGWRWRRVAGHWLWFNKMTSPDFLKRVWRCCLHLCRILC